MEKVTITKCGDSAVVRWRWRSNLAAIPFVVVVMTSFDLGPSVLDVMRGVKPSVAWGFPGQPLWFQILGSGGEILFGLLWLISAYVFLAFWLNRTSIRRRDDLLVIASGPVPWLAKKPLPISGIREVRISTYQWRTPASDMGPTSFTAINNIKVRLGPEHETRVVGGIMQAKDAELLRASIASLVPQLSGRVAGMQPEAN